MIRAAGKDAIDQLRRRLLTGRHKWPIPAERTVQEQLGLWAALRENDEPYLRRLHEWPTDRTYVIDPLPEKIASGYGNLLFGSDPTFTPAGTGDADRLAALVETNELPSGLQAGEETCASEGEVWGRLANTGLLPNATVSFHSRADVVPLFAGSQPVAVGFVTTHLDPADPDSRRRFRHIELHAWGRVENALYSGRVDALGEEVALTAHPETETLDEVFDHGLAGMLATRFVNKLGRRPHFGRSEYQGVWTLCLALNESRAIGAENARLTGKKRAVVPASSITAPAAVDQGLLVDNGDGQLVPRSGATFDAGEDVLVAESADANLGEGGGGPFKVLEYSFDAEGLMTYQRDLAETIVTRCDLVPQFIGQGDFGTGASGTALRVRLLPTENAARGKARSWDDQLPKFLSVAAQLEKLAPAQGGLGIPWTSAGEPIGVRRGDPFPTDGVEEAESHSRLKQAGLLSIDTSLRQRFPEKDDDWYDDERQRILDDQSSGAPAPLF